MLSPFLPCSVKESILSELTVSIYTCFDMCDVAPLGLVAATNKAGRVR